MSITPTSQPHPLDRLGMTGRDLYDATEPATWAEDAPDPRAPTGTDYAWARFLGALSTLLDPIAEVCRSVDGYERWTQLASPERCPTAWLPVLAQWAGIRRPDIYTEVELRALIATGGPAFWRGTRQNMIAMIRHLLPPGTPDNHIYFEERADGDPYRLRVFTYSFVKHDPDQVRKVLELNKPAGLFPFEYEVRDGQTYSMGMTCLYTYWQVNVGFDDWWDYLNQEPEVCRTVPPTPSSGDYAELVRSHGPVHYWRLGEPT